MCSEPSGEHSRLLTGGVPLLRVLFPGLLILTKLVPGSHLAIWWCEVPANVTVRVVAQILPGFLLVQPVGALRVRANDVA